MLCVTAVQTPEMNIADHRLRTAILASICIDNNFTNLLLLNNSVKCTYCVQTTEMIIGHHKNNKIVIFNQLKSTFLPKCNIISIMFL